MLSCSRCFDGYLPDVHYLTLPALSCSRFDGYLLFVHYLTLPKHYVNLSALF